MTRRLFVGLLAVAMAWAGAALADPVDEATARKALFKPRGADLVMVRDNGLDAGQSAIMETIAKGLRSGNLANYYGSVAVSPDFFALMQQDPGQAVLTGLMQVTERLHSPATADAVALAACNAARSAGQSACVIAARILPRRWEPRDLTMSVDATRAFRDYRRARAPKAFAISEGSRAYAVTNGDGAIAQALADCNAAALVADCSIVVSD